MHALVRSYSAASVNGELSLCGYGISFFVCLWASCGIVAVFISRRSTVANNVPAGIAYIVGFLLAFGSGYRF